MMFHCRANEYVYVELYFAHQYIIVFYLDSRYDINRSSQYDNVITR